MSLPNTIHPQFNFSTFWNSDSKDVQLERASKMWTALVLSGMTHAEATATINHFQRQAYDDGYSESRFDSCGEDA